MSAGAGPARRFCWYCGCLTTGKRACAAHRDLERLDPSAQAERPPASEAELGVTPQWKVPRHGGREELY